MNVGRQAAVPVREIPVDINQPLLPPSFVSRNLLVPPRIFFPPLRVRWPTSGWKFAFRELYHPSNLLPPYFHLDGNTESVRSDDRTLPPAVTYPPPILSSYSQTFFPNLHHFISSPFFLVASFFRPVIDRNIAEKVECNVTP